MRRVVAPLALLLLAGCSSSSKTTPETTTSVGATTTTLSPAAVALNRRAMKDVAVRSCAANTKHDLEIRGTAHNTTDSRADYTMQIAIADKSGKRLYATAASVDGVAPGATGRWSAVTSAPYKSGMTCTVTSVSVQPAH